MLRIEELPKEQIYVAAHPNYFPETALVLAKKLADAHGKQICFLGVVSGKEDSSIYTNAFESWTKDKLGYPVNYYAVEEGSFTDFMEFVEAAILVFEYGDLPPYNKPAKQLKLCRELRIPYYFVKPGQTISFNRVLVPIGFLVEEREKGVFCSGMGRHFQSHIMLMPAHDYGTRAQQNTEAIQKVMDKSSLDYELVAAKKNSFKIELEAVEKVDEMKADLLMISASREYGMDDILFGPKELKVIKKTSIPLMIINPRKDLYALCN
ncbi:MAG: hypothetical protein MJZ14_06275 [Paludibacteraceae bacterium]|nr:hypothetical protein [Paludibacteraceae bacterium]